MPSGKSKKKFAGSAGSGWGDRFTLVYVVGILLTLSFAWVLWPYLAEFFPSSDQEKQVHRLEQENPNAEVFTLPTTDSKKNP